MERIKIEGVPRVAKRPGGAGAFINAALFGLFLVQLALVSVRIWEPAFVFGAVKWPEALLLVLATATTLASLTRQLPGEKVLLAAAIIAFIGAGVQMIGALTAVPFGPFVYTETIGDQLVKGLPWAVPLLWIVLVLNSRGVGRMILRPWRKTRTYGFRLMGLTVALVVFLELGLEPFAARVGRYWLWQPTKTNINWYGAPLVNFLGWAVTALLILAFATPALINKRPVKQPVEYQPLSVWVSLNLLFALAAVSHQLWAATIVIVAGSLVTSVIAIRGARW